MTVKPKVTVCICTYNRAEMLRESIQSVLNQSYRDMKIVVLDNCSTDNTKELVLSFNDERERE
jgi:glycosyltransferase involved in cell wall biosynthesis